MKDLTNKDGEGDVTQEKETVEKDEAEKSDEDILQMLNKKTLFNRLK